MLIFNQMDKYGVNDGNSLSFQKTFPKSSSKTHKNKKKLTLSNIKFLKSLGFKLKQ